MATFDLFTDFDPAKIMGFGKKSVDFDSRSKNKVIRTYDAYRDVVTFAYPDIRTNSIECREALEAAMMALRGDKFAIYDGQIHINAEGNFFEISMSRWDFEQIFATKLTLRLHNPGNIIAKYAPLATGKDVLLASITPSEELVTLIYDNIHTPENKRQTIEALLQNLPQSAKDKIGFGEVNQSLTLLLPVRVYESLTLHKVPLIRQVQKDQF